MAEKRLSTRHDRPGRQGYGNGLHSVQRFITTGAPGTGKTALVAALADVGVAVSEAARELIAEQAEATGERSLDHAPELFVDRLIQRSIDKCDEAPDEGIVIYDRALPDRERTLPAGPRSSGAASVRLWNSAKAEEQFL